MFSVLPSIDPKVSSVAPGFRALSIAVEAAPIINPRIAGQALEQACHSISAGG